MASRGRGGKAQAGHNIRSHIFRLRAVDTNKYFQRPNSLSPTDTGVFLHRLAKNGAVNRMEWFLQFRRECVGGNKHTVYDFRCVALRKGLYGRANVSIVSDMGQLRSSLLSGDLSEESLNGPLI